MRTYFGLDPAALTLALAVLTRLPGARRLPSGLHLPGSDAWTVLARSGEHLRWTRTGTGSRGPRRR
ncbi:hypothetical protein [Nocardiopsis sp. LOL_012]|uniref:hypothetical protein n=1 Tax=Nocardiopsis sp. LOL_012 TaxID=3345409 RepID=UPI003A83F460